MLQCVAVCRSVFANQETAGERQWPKQPGPASDLSLRFFRERLEFRAPAIRRVVHSVRRAVLREFIVKICVCVYVFSLERLGFQALVS